MALLWLLLLLLVSSPAWARDVTLAWDANVEQDIAGYRLYRGTEKVDVGNVTEYTLTGLTENTCYKFYATAYDTSNNESGFSNPACTEECLECLDAPGALTGATGVTATEECEGGPPLAEPSTTTLLDNFSHGDDPLSDNANWDPIVGGGVYGEFGAVGGICDVNNLAGPGNLAFNAWTTSKASVLEVIIDIVTKPADGSFIQIYMSAGYGAAADFDGYYVSVDPAAGAGNDAWLLYSLENGSDTLIDNGTSELSNGDRIALVRDDAGPIEAWHYTSGSWTKIVEKTDDETWSGPYYITLGTDDANVELDNLYGGAPSAGEEIDLVGLDALTITGKGVAFNAETVLTLSGLDALAITGKDLAPGTTVTTAGLDTLAITGQNLPLNAATALTTTGLDALAITGKNLTRVSGAVLTLSGLDALAITGKALALARTITLAAGSLVIIAKSLTAIAAGSIRRGVIAVGMSLSLGKKN